ncbi:MAG: P1 family peptidase [SAR202 cluster bacterium]|nr:P1 family peptidase [SAR202 cluster bacterium]
MNGTLTDVSGLEVGHYTDLASATGCTVVLCRDSATGGVDVRGAAPGTRETDLLRAENMVLGVHGLLLSGGSAFGLAAATGVMRYLEERGVGHRVGPFVVPIVPGAIVFDLGIGSSTVRPGEAEGYAAASAASAAATPQGTVGAGTGATVGKALGRSRAMKGGVGSASIDLGEGVVIAALAVVNAIGGVVEPASGRLLAGPRGQDGRPRDSVEVYASPVYGRHGVAPVAEPPAALGNTTLAVVATNVRLSKAQANRLAMVAHDGLALAIRPCHTVHDGDTVFALATGKVDAPDEFPRLCALAPTATARAIVHAVRHATGLHGIPSMGEVDHDG